MTGRAPRSGLFADGASPPSSVAEIGFPALPGASAAQALALAAQLDASQWWSPERLRERQLAQLDALVRHAAATTAYGRAHFPGRARRALGWEDFGALPILSRETLQREADALRSERCPPAHGPVSVSRSSGSTSRPVEVPRTAVSGLVWHALGLREHTWHARDGRETLAVIRYAPEAAAPRGAGRVGWTPTLAMLGYTGRCEVLHVGASSREQLVWLERVQPAYLQLYPSSLADLLALSPHLPVPDLRAVFTFGEVVDPGLRAALREGWGLPLQDTYSAEEVGIIAVQCPESEALHLQAEGVYVEVLRPDGQACAPGEVGRVVVTPLHHFAMPLVRYELGDQAVLGPPCACGRGLPVLERVVGRVHQTFETASGDRVWLTVGVHRLPSLGPVAQHQLVQRAPGVLEVRLVAHRPPSAAEDAALHEHFRAALPAGTTFTLRWVAQIPRGPTGKFFSFLREDDAPMRPTTR